MPCLNSPSDGSDISGGVTTRIPALTQIPVMIRMSAVTRMPVMTHMRSETKNSNYRYLGCDVNGNSDTTYDDSDVRRISAMPRPSTVTQIPAMICISGIPVYTSVNSDDRGTGMTRMSTVTQGTNDFSGVRLDWIPMMRWLQCYRRCVSCVRYRWRGGERGDRLRVRVRVCRLRAGSVAPRIRTAMKEKRKEVR